MKIANKLSPVSLTPLDPIENVRQLQTTANSEYREASCRCRIHAHRPLFIRMLMTTQRTYKCKNVIMTVPMRFLIDVLIVTTRFLFVFVNCRSHCRFANHLLFLIYRILCLVEMLSVFVSIVGALFIEVNILYLIQC